ncbi:polysaccharide pyruvyl transferase family protein [Methyloversatilis sp.]|uniref:polysaccharide pyruvyl transferase family protein n=1 Tax=Methyloversatilis sp. TaxID=2569862 RepID=UPI002736C789|nr:polysaccharide pyruvyl transferase family protein [Methyloversatilis sp.]MDP3455943.1 polysaccharide pyruvyl transferase family protein [Methyloversatilis sp.]
MVDKALTTVTVGLLWHSLSSDNLGVGALTESQINICQAAALKAGVAVRFIVLGTAGGRWYPPIGVDVVYGGRPSFRQWLLGKSDFSRSLDKCDLILDIGEGDSFTDIYGIKRFTFLLISKLLVLAKRKPLILSPQTIGPFNSMPCRYAAAWVMRRADKVYARDSMSRRYLSSMGLDENAAEAIDVAFRLRFDKPDKRSEGKLQIGMNVSGLLFSGGYSGGNQFRLATDYPKLVRQLLARWSDNAELDVWLVPHVLPNNLPNDDDRVAIRTLATEFPGVRVAPDFSSPSEAKSFIASMDFFTGARMHACIAAFSSGVPVIPVAYSRKFNGLFSSLGYSYVADAVAHSTDVIEKFIVNGMEIRSELSAAVKRGNDHAFAQLAEYERELEVVFTQLGGRARTDPNGLMTGTQA